METIIHFIIFLTAVIEIVLLVRFFALCNHVEEIKKKMVPNENFQAIIIGKTKCERYKKRNAIIRV